MSSENKKTNAVYNESDKLLYKNLIFILTAISVGSALLFAFCLSPLIAYSNVEATIPYLSDIFYAVYWVFDLLVFFICYALTDFCFYRFKLSKAIIAVVIFSASTLSKYALNIVSSFYVFGSYPTSNEALKDEILPNIISSSAELIQYLIVSAFALIVISKKNKLSEISRKSASKIGVEFDKRTLFFPFKKLFDIKNPMFLTAFVTSITVAIIKIVPNRLIYDIWVGLPTSILDGLWMFIAYATDILFCVLGYFVMIYVFSKADTKDLALKIKSEK